MMLLTSELAYSATTVGVIGGGAAGLSCALRLQELGQQVTLYDTGKRGPGGRASSISEGGRLCVQ